MASKKTSKKTGSGTPTGTKKTISKSRTHGSKSKSKSKTRTNTHRSKSGTRTTKHTTKGTKSRGTSGTSRTSNSNTTRSRSHTTIFDSSSIGPGFNDPLLFVFLIILALSVIVLIVVGIWLLAARNGWPHGLNTAGNETYTRLISYGTACLIAGILLIFAIVFTLLGAIAKTGAAARINRLIAIFVVSLVFIIFILMIIFGIMFAANKPAYIANMVRDGWVKTVVQGPVDDVCDIERKYDCQGWYDNQCRTCRPTVDGVYDYTAPPGSSCDISQRSFCPRCFPPVASLQRDVVSAMDIDTGITPRRTEGRNVSLSNLSNTVRSEVIGCRYFVRRRNRTFFIPFTVYIFFLTIILLFLSWKTCLDSAGRR